MLFKDLDIATVVSEYVLRFNSDLVVEKIIKY